MRLDYLIVGQGLAGSLLAWELLNRQYKVLVVDAGLENASQIAAGIVNPMTGPRFAKAPETDLYLASAMACYSKLAKDLDDEFYHAQAMCRLLQSELEVKAILKRFKQPDYLSYLEPSPAILAPQYPFQSPFGCINQQQTAVFKTRPLLQKLKGCLLAQGKYQQTDFQYADLQIEPHLQWQDIRPRRVIFCEGYRLQDNPWFSWLPLQAVKGEILTLAMPQALPSVIWHYGDWLLPIENQQCRVGATFDREAADISPTDAGEQYLRQNLHKVAPSLAQARKIAHHANFRPCTPDRQPLLGFHPELPQLGVFNGFGAKGSLQIPWFSQYYAAALSGQGIAPKYNISRFMSRYPGILR